MSVCVRVFDFVPNSNVMDFAPFSISLWNFWEFSMKFMWVSLGKRIQMQTHTGTHIQSQTHTHVL